MKPSVGLFILSSLLTGRAWCFRDVESRSNKRQADPNLKRIVCYYESWAVYRNGDSKFGPEDIDPYVCTHLLYAYARLDDRIIGLEPFDPLEDIDSKGYEKFVNLKNVNPNLKVILSVGGSKEGSLRFSKYAGDPRLRSLFAKNSKNFLKQFNFDGLDIVWKYPNFTEGSSYNDKENYVELVKEIRNEYKEEYSISIVVPPLIELIDRGFDIPELSKYVDFMTVLTYDYQTATQPTVGHIAPLYPSPDEPDDFLNVDASIKVYTNLDVDLHKLNMALPFFGFIYVLEDPNETDIGSNTADEGEGTQERGVDIYNNFCQRIINESWIVKHVNKSTVGPYAYKDKTWISYDDADMIRTKARYAIEKKLGGLMIWGLDMDDFKGLCHPQTYPLVKAAGEAFLNLPTSDENNPPANALPTITSSMATSRMKTTLMTTSPLTTSTMKTSELTTSKMKTSWINNPSRTTSWTNTPAHTTSWTNTYAPTTSWTNTYAPTTSWTNTYAPTTSWTNTYAPTTLWMNTPALTTSWTNTPALTTSWTNTHAPTTSWTNSPALTTSRTITPPLTTSWTNTPALTTSKITPMKPNTIWNTHSKPTISSQFSRTHLPFQRPNTQETQPWNTETDSTIDSFFEITGSNSIHSNRDVVFQSIELWINNLYYAQEN